MLVMNSAGHALRCSVPRRFLLREARLLRVRVRLLGLAPPWLHDSPRVRRRLLLLGRVGRPVFLTSAHRHGLSVQARPARHGGAGCRRTVPGNPRQAASLTLLLSFTARLRAFAVPAAGSCLNAALLTSVSWPQPPGVLGGRSCPGSSVVSGSRPRARSWWPSELDRPGSSPSLREPTPGCSCPSPPLCVCGTRVATRGYRKSACSVIIPVFR